MMKSDPILEQDILIGQYTLGALSPQENQRIQTLLSSDDAAARSALQWEGRFLALVDALPPADPSHTLLEQVLTALDLPFPTEETAPIADAGKLSDAATLPDVGNVSDTGELSDVATLSGTVSLSDTDTPPDMASLSETSNLPDTGNEPEASPLPDDTSDPLILTTIQAEPVRPEKAHHLNDPATGRQIKKQTSRTIRTGSIAAIIILSALLILFIMPRQPAEPPVVIMEIAPSKGAILQAPGQSSTPGWVVTIDLENNITLTPQVHTETQPDTSVQLWTYNTTLPQPRSLGLIDPNQPVIIPAGLMGEIDDGQFFEMTLEPAGGSPAAEPSGPILFIGQVVTFS